MSLIERKVELEVGTPLMPQLKTFTVIDMILVPYRLDNGRELDYVTSVTNYFCLADDGEIRIVAPTQIKQIHE